MTSIIVATVIVGALLFAICAYFLWRWTSKRSGMFACSVIIPLMLLRILVLILCRLSVF